MRIRKLYLKDIGPFDEVEFEFKPQEKGKAEIHILTGPNGSGKTTVLQALASIFSHQAGQLNAFSKKFRYFDKDNEDGYRSQLKASFDEGQDVGIFGAGYNASQMGFAFSGHNEFVDYYRGIIGSPSPTFTTPLVVVAYSGYRYTQATYINAIQEFKTNPLASSLEFIKEPSKNGFTVNQWIANSISKRAIEKEKHNPKIAQKFASALSSLEKVVSEIIGYSIEFEIKTNPLTLTIKTNHTVLDFDVLPDGIRSLISWMGDLLMRLDLLTWTDETPLNEQNIILFLDEIEIHLHPAWQRKVLPAVQKLFPTAQIFLTTHSPFVVNSVDGAAVYELKVKEGKAYLGEVTESKSGNSYQNVLREVFDIDEDFGAPTQDNLDKFYLQLHAILQGEDINESAFLKLAKSIAQQGVELQNIVIFELRQLSKLKKKTYEI